MNAEQLETSPPGDILLAILRVWNKKEVVTVRHFSDVCSELGITAIEQRLKMVKPNTKEVEQTRYNIESIASLILHHCSAP